MDGFWKDVWMDFGWILNGLMFDGFWMDLDGFWMGSDGILWILDGF